MLRRAPPPPQVQLDSITSNELGDPGALVHVAGRPDITVLSDWQSQPNLGGAPGHPAAPHLPPAPGFLRSLKIKAYASHLRS